MLSDEAFERFTAMLDKPPRDNPKLRRLLQTRARREPDRRSAWVPAGTAGTLREERETGPDRIAPEQPP